MIKSKASRFTSLKAYKQLQEHFTYCSDLHMRRLFSIDPERHKRMSLEFDWLLLDYSKNRVTDTTLTLLFELAREAKLDDAIADMFKHTKENKHATLHTAIRSGNSDSQNAEVELTLQRMKHFTTQVHKHEIKGYSNKPITDIVNIGIGGSELGVQSVCCALRPYHQPNALNMHFVSNVDGANIEETLAPLNPDTTLFIISCKSFTSAETITNANTAKRWLLAKSNNIGSVAKHFIAITAQQEAAQAFGITEDYTFNLCNRLDDRFAIWSATGLPIMLSIGVKHFSDFLAGAYEMDEHYRIAPFEENMPVIMALIGIWYNNFFNAESQAILTYDFHLSDLPKYIEQIEMQGNGKSIDRDGNKVDFPTGPIIWGGNGLHTQHAFYQMLHRGKKIIPADFIVSMRTHSTYQDQHNQLFSNAIAQAEALMRGRNLHETITHIEHTPGGFDQDDIDSLPHRIYSGNNPSNMLLMQRLTPKSLGIILSLYEHKTFTQGAIWGLNSSEQQEIELGDSMSNMILQHLKNGASSKGQHDASTNALINHYKKTVYPEHKNSV